MIEVEALKDIDQALTQRGFRRDWTQSEQVTYAGELDCHGYKVAVSVAIPDLDLVHLPVIRPEHPERLPPLVLPHLLPGNSVCYFQSGAVVLDRYRPGGTLLTCLDRAADVIGKAVDQSLYLDQLASLVNVSLKLTRRRRREFNRGILSKHLHVREIAAVAERIGQMRLAG